MKNLYIALLMFLFVYNCPAQQNTQPQISDSGKIKMNRLFEAAIEKNKVPGLVAVVANKSEILYYQGFGKLDVTNNISMPKDAIFKTGSMTKPITAVGIMILYEEGLLSLDDPASKYIPFLKNLKVIRNFKKEDRTYESSPAKNEITIRHLLNNTSGFGYTFSNHTLKLLQDKTGKDARDLPLVHEPGNKWTYGVSSRILGDIIQKITGSSLSSFFQTKIFMPLGMTDTFYSIPQQKYHRFVTMHLTQDGKRIELPKPKVEAQEVTILGDYGLRSTAKDYIRFLQMLLNKGSLNGKQILKKSSVELMIQNQIGSLVVEEHPGAKPMLSNAFPRGAGVDKFGLGFQIKVASKDSDLRSPGSYSWSGLFNTHFWVDPKEEIVAVIFMQVLPFYDTNCMEIYQDYEELIYQNIR
ncbi:serine hydrolase domain-containing protein [Candidatus Uabimicrobium amorphum]|uniref:1,4-butanediol diacrylate esterase n=1 Tax=Uabimicrobium amorphum TaxID=2596890 RepID=A0A5S9IRJ4_UABAM|nr:serine hydrolase domain-containing protein [Candidatus Uabimicrobium amorphum]BBM85850.1 1,4-butanediol diacrylate esterase [Candidatus Uabimicrobium amorphum]